MEKVKIREDNKKIYTFMYILLTIYAGVVAYINIMHTKNLVVLYTLFGTTIFMLILTTIFLIIKRKKNITLVDSEPTEILLYQSTAKENKKTKILVVFFDLLSILLLSGLTYYFFFKMDYVRAYDYYGLIIMGAILLFLILILVKDIIRINQLDRCDTKSILSIFSYDKKVSVALMMILMAIFNIGILSFNVPHFKVYWIDLLFFELIGLFTTISFILSLYFDSKYYSNFTFKKIEQDNINAKVLECVGKGTFASVYKVYIPSLDTVFALKRLDSTKEKNVKKFEREFYLLKSLEHKNLISVYSFNEIKLEYMMDYMDFNLQSYLETHALDDKTKKDLANQLLDGMEYLHNHSIVHGDLASGNVMIKVTKDNELVLKITDFGLSNNKPLAFAKTRTNTHPAFEDPTLRSANTPTYSNDIYAIGGLINYIYTGNPYVELKDDALSKVISKCMDLNVSNRYKNIQEIKEALKGVNI